MNANKQDAGGLPPLPDKYATVLNGRDYYTPHQMRAYGELCRAAPAGGVECFVREMRTSKGSEFFVVVKLGDRELTPHMYTERWKAEYDVASWQHLLCGAPKPDILAYGPSAPLDSAPSGSWEVDALVGRLYAAARHVDLASKKLPDTFNGWEARDIAEAAALLRKLQQGAEDPELLEDGHRYRYLMKHHPERCLGVDQLRAASQGQEGGHARD